MTAVGGRPAASSPADPGQRSGAPGGADCHYCGHVLPRGRAITFCPHCGQNVTVRRCPACSAEADVGWRFCVCCGRSMGG